MKLKKINFIEFSLVIILLAAVGVLTYKFISYGYRDIESSKKFMEKLYSINAVDTSKQELSNIKYEKVKILTSKNELVDRSVLTQNFGIDLDKNNNVIGFAKKDIPMNGEVITLEEAQSKAEDYLRSIYDCDVVLKSAKNDESLPYYTFIYTKEEHGYEFYFDEIKVNIDKENGFLDGYSNSAMQREHKEPIINISNEDAGKIALGLFDKYNKNSIINEKDKLVYTDNKLEKESDNIAEVCYMITINGQDDNNNEVTWKIFVNAANGEIFNTLKDGVEKEVTVK